MKHLDLIFIMVGVAYTCYGLMAVLLKLEYQNRRRHRRS